ncbi:MAG: hypothetical protein Q9199_002321 [Rusavskia elegans]
MSIPQLSVPGWALAGITTLTIATQAPNIYKPQAFMTEFELPNKPAAQFIGESAFVESFAFCLVLINGYDLLGALQDNWTVYWYSLISRTLAMGMFWAMAKPWNKLVVIEAATFLILGTAMWFG